MRESGRYRPERSLSPPQRPGSVKAVCRSPVASSGSSDRKSVSTVVPALPRRNPLILDRSGCQLARSMSEVTTCAPASAAVWVA